MERHTLQHQDDGEPLGNLAESGAMQTLELRCGHSMVTSRAARKTEARGPGDVWAEGLGRLRLGSLLAGRSADGGCVPSPCVKESKGFRAPGFPTRRLQKPRSEERGILGSGFYRHPQAEGFRLPRPAPPRPQTGPAHRPTPPLPTPAGWGPGACGRVAERFRMLS